MRRCLSESDRRALAASRRTRAMFFIGALALLTAVLGASVDPNHRLSGFLFGGLLGAAIGIALLAWPRDDYPPDIWDKTLD